jgi:hypothetical protein
MYGVLQGFFWVDPVNFSNGCRIFRTTDVGLGFDLASARKCFCNVMSLAGAWRVGNAFFH